MPTIKDVAKLAGTSVSTVSIVLNGKTTERKISQSTQERVRRAIAELGYTPNHGARSLRAATRKPIIALFWAMDWRSVMLARFLQGIELEMTQRNAPCEVVVQPYPPGHLSAHQALAGVPAFDALIIGNADEHDLDYLANHPISAPVVLYNRRLDGYSWAAVDDREVGRLAAEALQSCRHIAMLTAQTTFSGLTIRENAFSGHLASGARTTIIDLDAMTPDAGYHALRARPDLLCGTDACDAVFAPSDSVAFGAMRACAEAGARIPQDIQVLAVGNGIPEYAAYSVPSLSTIEIPIEEMAALCLDSVLNAWGHVGKRADVKIAEHTPDHMLVTPRLQRRESLL